MIDYDQCERCKRDGRCSQHLPNGSCIGKEHRKRKLAAQAAAAIMLGMPVKSVSLEHGLEFEDSSTLSDTEGHRP